MAVKQISWTMTSKPSILSIWVTIVVLLPEGPLPIFVGGSPGEVAAVWVLGSEVGGKFPPVGVAWFGFYFLFLGCWASQCCVTESDDCRSSARVMTFKPLEAWSFTCHLGRCKLGRQNWPRPNPACRLEALRGAREACADQYTPS